MTLNLNHLIKVHPYQIASRNLSKDLNITESVTLFAMAKGETISSEKAELQKFVIILEGNLLLTIDGVQTELSLHDFLVIKQGQVHELEALDDSKFLQIQQN
ncbi:cupin domain-containing protein [Streptococcus dentiloxodontae]